MEVLFILRLMLFIMLLLAVMHWRNTYILGFSKVHKDNARAYTIFFTILNLIMLVLP